MLQVWWNDSPSKRPRESLSDMLVDAPLDRLATNILGPFLESIWGNKYVILVTDYFTKLIEIFAIPNQSAVTYVEVIFDEDLGCYGCP